MTAINNNSRLAISRCEVFTYRDGCDNKYRKPTRDEIDKISSFLVDEKKILNEIAELNKKLKRLREKNGAGDNCKHQFFYDTAGHPYDVRHCVLCGYASLIQEKVNGY